MAGVRKRYQIIIAAIVGTAFMMEQLDATILTTSTPQIAAALGQSPLRINLAITSYLITLITLMPASGWLSNRFGARRVFCVALGIFTLGSALCGLATSLPMLLAMRMLQGMGGGLMTPVGRSILLRAFPRSEMVKAMTWFNIPIVIGPTLGPVVGGLITTYASWPWIFYVNVPFGVAGILCARRLVPDVKQAGTAAFDVTGFLLGGAALVLLQIAVQGLGMANIPWLLMAFALVGTAGFAGLYIMHSRAALHPILDFSLMRIRSFRIGVLAGGLSRVGINGLPYLLPLMLQLGFGKSPLESGFLVAVTCLGIVLVRPAAGKLLRQFGFGPLLFANTMLGAACLAAFALLNATTSDAIILLTILAFSLMRGMQFTTLNTLCYADIPRERLNVSTSLGGIAQQMTMGLGISISAAMLNIFSNGGSTLDASSFQRTFIVLVLPTLLASPWFLRLRWTDGAKAVPTGQATDRSQTVTGVMAE